MDFSRIKELVKEHYKTGRYSNCFLKMHPAGVHALKEYFIPDAPIGNLIDPRTSLFGRPMLSDMMGIPIIIDTFLAVDEWMLTDRAGNILEHVRLNEELETHGD